MIPTPANRVILMLTAAVAVVGAVDAGTDGEWDLVVLLGFIVILQMTLLLRLSARRISLPLRADLVRWLRDRAAAEGDSAELIADRAVSAYRAGLVDSTGPTTGDVEQVT